LEETKVAVRHVRWFAVLALVLFGLMASMTGPDSYFVEYGRENAASWNLWKLRQLDESTVRSHPGGKVVWLVGSSMLRDSFDEQALNQALSERGSEYRAVKFGQARGATGLSRGILRGLPLQAGDLVLHGMSVENLRKEWVEFSRLPDWRLMLMSTESELWSIPGWGLQQKLETTVARPRNFFMYQEESMTGWYNLSNSVLWMEKAKKPKGFNHLQFRRRQKLKVVDAMLNDDGRFRNHMNPGDLDTSDEQFNLQGLKAFRTLTADAGAELVLFEHPGRRQYREVYIHPEVQSEWEAWWWAQPEAVTFPQPEEDHFYDTKHPNRDGREMLTSYLVDWVENRWQRPPAGWLKTWKAEPEPATGVLPEDREEDNP
jgi:hypothetical protein